MHSFVLADASHQELPTTFIETKLHFNLFLVSSISVSDLFSLFLSFAFDVLISCALLILIHPPPSSLLDAIRMFPSMERRQRAEPNLIVCTNFHLGNKLCRQTHVFRIESQCSQFTEIEKKEEATTTSGNNAFVQTRDSLQWNSE